MNLLRADHFKTNQIANARGWFFLGVFSLIASGIFSLLLVLSRTPTVSEFIPWIDFFHTALVVHVDLSVLIWFLSFTAIFWSLNNSKKSTLVDKLSLILASLGTLFLVITPFTGQAHPIINNYIPVLNDPLYLTGLGIIGLAFFIYALRSLAVNNYPAPFQSIANNIRIATSLSSLIVLISLIALLISYLSLQSQEANQTYYEFLFWGSGHTLQFSHTVLLLMAWLWLLNGSGINIQYNPKTVMLLVLLTCLPVLAVPYIYTMHPVLSPEHRTSFTELMRYGGLTALPLGLLITWTSLKLLIQPVNPSQKPVKAALLASIILFATGGILGFMIEGINVVIPAHYHGSIVGVTLAFMGITYLLLPMFGYQSPVGKLAQLQPVIYASGQMMHIIGLAWSGGYGVQRKTAGAAQGLESLAQKAGMGLMGLGGLVAIIGGVIFLIIIYKSVTKKFHTPTL